MLLVPLPPPLCEWCSDDDDEFDIDFSSEDMGTIAKEDGVEM